MPDSDPESHLPLPSPPQEAFNLFDTDHSGTIDERELKVAMRALGIGVSSEEVTAIMREYDRDKSGGIEFDEFRDIMREKLRRTRPGRRDAQGVRGVRRR